LHIYPEDIERLFHEVPVGTQVRSVFQPVKAGWIDGRLYVEVHPSKEQADEIDVNQPMTPAEPQQLIPVVTKAAGDRSDLIDWDAVHAAGLAANGIPTAVTPAPADLQASDPSSRASNTVDTDDQTVVISGRGGRTTVPSKLVPPVAGVSLPAHTKPQEAALRIEK
jgi:hypothetical protein